MIELILSDTR